MDMRRIPAPPAMRQPPTQILPAWQPTAQQPPPRQVYISAYAKDFTLSLSQGNSKEGEDAALPLEQQRVSGGFTLKDGTAAVPADGYYMLLWELGVDEARGEARLHLGINEGSAQLTHGMQPGCDSAQQVTWLSAGDRVKLLAKGKGTFKCSGAMLTIVRLG